MLRALAILLTCQLVGEAITRSLELPLPGPVLGLLILVAILFAVERWRLVDPSTIDETSLGKVSNGLIATLRHPVRAGRRRRHPGARPARQVRRGARRGPAVSTVLTLVVTVWVFVGVSRLTERKD